MKLQPRIFRGEDDYARMQAFLRARQPWDRLPDYWHTGRSPMGIFLTLKEGEPSDHWFWEDEQGVIHAYTWLSPLEPTYTLAGNERRWQIQFHPEVRTREFAAGMVQHAEARLAMRPGPCAQQPLETVAYGSDTWLATLLEASGYQRDKEIDVYMKMPLTGELSAPEPPAGFAVRALKGEAEFEERAAAQRNSFGGEPSADAWSMEDVRLQIRFDEGRDNLDLVVVAANGVVASYAHMMSDPVTGHGEFDPVGTRSAFRRMGLAQAMLRLGLRSMQEWQLQSAIIRTGADNEAAIALYESVGYRIVDRLYRYVRYDKQFPDKLEH